MVQLVDPARFVLIPSAFPAL
ncbi:hypothetical protein OFS94_01905 [Escherichia coli]|nr:MULTISPECIES: hypothetical protein [Escherichia]MCV5809765.1 hypothetical protein [Escherichia coli]